MQGTGILRSPLPRGGLVSFGSRRWLDWWLERLECLNLSDWTAFWTQTPPTSFGGLVLISFSTCHPLTPGIEMHFCLEWVAFIEECLTSWIHTCCVRSKIPLFPRVTSWCARHNPVWTIGQSFSNVSGRRVRIMSTYSSKQMKTQTCICYSLTSHLFGGTSDIRVESTILGLL